MAINGEVELPWGDGEHKFNIAKLKCILELEEKCGVGVAEIYYRIASGKWRWNDCRETLRLGLIGANMTPDKALRLIQRYCDDRPMIESALPAQAVLAAAMAGVPGDNFEKKPEAERAKESQSITPMADSSVPSSTDSVPPSASIHDS
jgi:Phage tail tube protein, GTA-gp10